MTRRRSSLRIVALALVAHLAFGADARDVTAAQKPNVLLVTFDDLSDWVGCLEGHPDARTPNLDALAEEGVLFTNAHAQAAVCNPSRTSLFLGQRPSTTGIYDNRTWFRDVDELRERVTLPELFAEEGYLTLAVGKVFHGSEADPKSFEVVGPDPGPTTIGDERRVTRAWRRAWDWGPQDYPQDEFSDARIAAWASERLGQEHERPFFLAVGFHRPHLPLYAPPKWFAAVAKEPALAPAPEGDLDDVPAIALDRRGELAPKDSWFRMRTRALAATRAYLAATAFVDDELGQVLDALDAGPNADDTIVVVLSDHGMHLGEKEVWGKRTLWERSSHVPLVLRVPGHDGGARVERTVELLDVFPTLVELCGLEASPQALDGRSLVPLLDDPDATWERAAITSLGPDSHAVRTDAWRFVSWEDGSEELYDRAKDPGERTNLADDEAYREHRDRLAELLPAKAAPNRSAARDADGEPGREDGR